MTNPNNFPRMKKIVLQTATISIQKGVQVGFYDFDIECESEHELVIQDFISNQPVYKVIRKNKSRFGAQTSLAPLALIDPMVSSDKLLSGETNDADEDIILTFSWYVPDFDVINENTDIWPAEWNNYGHFYTSNFYDALTDEMQKHEHFKHYAVDSNGDLVTRKKWENDNWG